jgi:RNA polymerase-binding transcription factor DksA
MASKKKSAKVKKLLAKKKSVRAAVPKKPASSAKRKSAPIAKSKPIKFSVKKSAKPAKTTPSKKPTKPVKTTPSKKPTKPVKTTPSKRPTKPAKTTLSKKPTKPVKTTPSKRPTKATKAVKPVKAAKAIKNSATKPVAPTKAPAKTKPAAKPASPPPPVMSKSSLKSAKPAAAAALAASAATKPKIAGKGAARDLLRSRILGRTKATAKAGKPISFSLDEVKEIARRVGHSTEKKSAAKSATTRAAALAPAGPSKPNHIGAASLAEILGFIPGKTVRPADDESVIPEKFKRYYKLLIELRNHLTGQLDTHTEETLKRSSKDDSGDLSSYGQHMADSGTDTFDRDFALSLVSSEQEALSEVESAIRRIKQGTYGVCEITGKPITRERLLAVPFTRNSAEAQKELERNRYHVRTQAGLFGEMGGEGAKIANDSDDD